MLFVHLNHAIRETVLLMGSFDEDKFTQNYTTKTSQGSKNQLAREEANHTIIWTKIFMVTKNTRIKVTTCDKQWDLLANLYRFTEI